MGKKIISELTPELADKIWNSVYDSKQKRKAQMKFRAVRYVISKDGSWRYICGDPDLMVNEWIFSINGCPC